MAHVLAPATGVTKAQAQCARATAAGAVPRRAWRHVHRSRQEALPQPLQQPANGRHITAHRSVSVARAGANGNWATAAWPTRGDALRTDGPILLWFKCDLRVDDHEGLLAAADAAAAHQLPLLPVFVLDPQQLSHLAFVPGRPAVLLSALGELRAGLRERGSNLLVVADGSSAEQAVPRLAQQYGCRSLVLQDEIEHKWASLSEQVASACAAQGLAVTWWTNPTWAPDAFKHNFRQWRTTRPAALPPRPPPDRLAALPDGAAVQASQVTLPSVDELTRSLQAAAAQQGAAIPPQVLRPLLAGAQAGEEAQRAQQLVQEGRDWLQRLAAYLAISNASGEAARSAAAAAVGGEALAGVLVRAVAAKETARVAAQGLCFPALFSAALAVGALSRRRVFGQVQAAGAGAGVQARAAAVTAESSDFHAQLAYRNDLRPPGTHPMVQQRHWRWNGVLTDYCMAEPLPGTERPGAPAVLLVHGFGAFGDQWRDNVEALAQAGFRVFAPTLPGFGRSEKVALAYSQVLWTQFLRDFVIQVVGAPVVVAGNSIGGFISANMAADEPDLVLGLALLNSAGPISAEGFSIEAWERDAAERQPPPRWLAAGISQALIWYLERTVPGTLQWLYPTRPERTRGWLTDEIERAAADVGALDVFASVFYLPPPRPLAWLISQRFKKPVLVLQGVLDPLNDAAGRARELGEACGALVEVSTLQAGHCPHDEVPDLVNRELQRWIEQTILAKGKVAAPAASAAA